ncbi:CHAT domain protein [compost metagenome]
MEAGKCKLLVLSSCSGASVRTALEVMRAGAAGVLAFRWQVEEESCALYIERFYDVYLDAAQPKGLAEAYRYACKAAQGDAGDLPTWASAMAIVRD